MTPKQKAFQFIDKYREAAKGQIFSDWDYYHKKCALICVEEIIDAINDLEDPSLFINGECTNSITYWVEVKKEITNQ